MIERGYAAVSTRQVAKRIGLTPALIHYYFPRTDDLLIAVFRRTAETAIEQLSGAFDRDKPLQALWSFSMDTRSTTLTLEFMAMANHREEIRAEIARIAPQFRAMQADALSEYGFDQHGQNVLNPLSITVLIIAVSRLLVFEEGLGISFGHEEVRAFMEYWVTQLEEGTVTKPGSV